MKTTAARVAELVAQQLCVSADTVTEERSFADCSPGADSLDHVEFVMALEDEFGVSLPDNELERLRPLPLAETVRYIDNRLAAAAA